MITTATYKDEYYYKDVLTQLLLLVTGFTHLSRTDPVNCCSSKKVFAVKNYHGTKQQMSFMPSH